MINTLVIVKIHQYSLYDPYSPCAFIRNASWLTDGSIQSCIWECVQEHDCQTAVYHHNEKICSMFAELESAGRVLPAGNIQASVICYRKNHYPIVTCSSTLTMNSIDNKETSTAEIMTTIPAMQITASLETTSSTIITSTETTTTSTTTTALMTTTSTQTTSAIASRETTSSSTSTTKAKSLTTTSTSTSKSTTTTTTMFPPNLLLNPGAENGILSPWISGGSGTPAIDDGSANSGYNPYSGTKQFYGGSYSLFSTNTLTQSVLLLNGTQGYTAAQLDSGNLAANISFYEHSYHQSCGTDQGSINLEFRELNNNLLSTVSTIPYTCTSGWCLKSASYSLPVGTRRIVYIMAFQGYCGFTIDSYFDDNSLTVH